MTTPHEGLGGFGENAASDPLPEATGLVRGASEAGYPLKILGGLGVRVLCPDFPPRLRPGLRGARHAPRPAIHPARFGAAPAPDGGWGRTVTGNLAKLPALLSPQPALAPPYPRFDALTQAKQLLEVAETVPKGIKWKTRARVGDRVRWYELPEEVDH